MGRGRQKAKQMKVARRLKYFTPDTDLDALQRELSGIPDEADISGGDEYSNATDADDYGNDYWDPGEWSREDSR